MAWNKTGRRIIMMRLLLRIARMKTSMDAVGILAMKTKLVLKKIIKRKKQFSRFLYQEFILINIGVNISFSFNNGTQVNP